MPDWKAILARSEPVELSSDDTQPYAEVPTSAYGELLSFSSGEIYVHPFVEDITEVAADDINLARLIEESRAQLPEDTNLEQIIMYVYNKYPKDPRVTGHVRLCRSQMEFAMPLSSFFEPIPNQV